MADREGPTSPQEIASGCHGSHGGRDRIWEKTQDIPAASVRYLHVEERALSDRWYIFKDGQQLGPMSSADIRSGLREGALDPFDLVARDGSLNVRRELVEVDEIFATSQVVYAESAERGAASSGQARALAGSGGGSGEASSSDMARLSSTVDRAAGGGFVPMAVPYDSSPDSTQVSDGRGIGRGHLALADDSTASRAAAEYGRGAPRQEARRRGKNAKRYSLVDAQGRVLGPMSAGEIQALFYKGVLDKSVVVQRQGSQARVAVAKFVSVYSESKRQMPVQQAAHPAFAPRDRGAGQHTLLNMMANYQRRVLENQRLVMIVVIIAGILLVAAAGWVLVKKAGMRFEWPTSERTTTLPRDPPRPPANYRPLPDTKPPRVATPKAPKTTKPTKPPKQVKPPRGKTQPRILDAPRPKSRAELRREEREKRAEAASRERQRRLRENAKLQLKTVIKPQPKPLPNPVVKPPPGPAKPLPKAPAAPKPPAASPGKGTTVASLTDGQTVSSLGPMTFDRATLQACKASCSVVFTGAGGSVQVNFFKQVWGPQLLAKPGGVYLTGIVRKRGGSTKLILQGVK